MCGQMLLPSPSGRCLVKLAMLLIFCCFAEGAAGSCIRYGHSCWGAHGKRSHQDSAPKNNALPLPLPLNLNIKNEALLNDDTRWFIARLLQTNDNRLLRGLRDQMDENQSEDVKIPDISASDGEQLRVGDDAPPPMFNDKLRLIKYL